MTGLSLFASAGIGEAYLEKCNVTIVAANELVEKRAELYKALYPKSKMVCGDITDKEVFKKVMEAAKGIGFLIASPPCQGMSVAGKNRNQETMAADRRNYLITYVVEAIKKLEPEYVLIENVPALLKVKLQYLGRTYSVLDLLEHEFGRDYQISSGVVDAADYGVPQTRLRAIIKMYPKDVEWKWPEIVGHKVTVQEAIGHLPSIEAGEKSNVKWHFARKHDIRHIEWMKHTATGTSAFSNEIYYPRKKDGTKIHGYESSYRRIRWDTPAPTITIRNDAISSQRNVHPGRLLEDGTYSDARVLTPCELMLLNSLPGDWNLPDDTPEILIRQVIGESIPPLLIEKIVGELPCLKR
ncbi:MAG: DNA cytosine methyltransferase [Lachnospiraceae bacterium]|nr:DNA cytosine methyltransferase [Lachnospiraceae bacterium]